MLRALGWPTIRHVQHRPWNTTRRLIGPLIEPLYALVVARRNRAFDRGQGVGRASIPVISIGNMTTGGTGKTPMVMLTCRLLAEMGRHPAIAMRGYKADGAGRSDEAEEYRRLLPDVPVLVGADRLASITAHLAGGAGGEHSAMDCVVLDDGFAHRRLHRDLDVVLLHAGVDLTTERLLPTGDLREPLGGLARAGLVVLTHAEPEVVAAVDAGTQWTCRLPAGLPRPRVMVRHVWAGLTDSHGVRGDLGLLAAVPTFAACAIGRPEAFVAEAGRRCKLVGSMVLDDHDAFAPATVAKLAERIAASGAKALLVTEKDWSKLSRLASGTLPCEVYRPELKLEVVRGGEVLRQAIASAVGAAVGSAAK